MSSAASSNAGKDGSETLKIGVLKKRGKHIWTNRQVKLFGTNLLYSRGKSDFRAVSLIESEEKILEDELSFQLKTMEGETLMFRAKSKHECFEWVVAIRKSRPQSTSEKSDEKYDARAGQRAVLAEKQNSLLTQHAADLTQRFRKILGSEIEVRMHAALILPVNVQIDRICTNLLGVFNLIMEEDCKLDSPDGASGNGRGADRRSDDPVSTAGEGEWYEYASVMKAGVAGIKRIVVEFSSPGNMLVLSQDKSILFYYIGSSDGEASYFKIRQHMAEFFLEKEEYFAFSLKEILRNATVMCKAQVELEARLQEFLRSLMADEFEMLMDRFFYFFSMAYEPFQSAMKADDISTIRLVLAPQESFVPFAKLSGKGILTLGLTKVDQLAPLQFHMSITFSEILRPRLQETVESFNKEFHGDTKFQQVKATEDFMLVNFEKIKFPIMVNDQSVPINSGGVMMISAITGMLNQKIIESVVAAIRDAIENDCDVRSVFYSRLRRVVFVLEVDESTDSSDGTIVRKTGYPFELVPYSLAAELTASAKHLSAPSSSTTAPSDPTIPTMGSLTSSGLDDLEDDLFGFSDDDCEILVVHVPLVNPEALEADNPIHTNTQAEKSEPKTDGEPAQQNKKAPQSPYALRWNIDQLWRRLQKASLWSYFVQDEQFDALSYGKFMTLKQVFHTFKIDVSVGSGMGIMAFPVEIQWSPIATSHDQMIGFLMHENNARVLFQCFAAALDTIPGLAQLMMPYRRTFVFVEEPSDGREPVALDITLEAHPNKDPRWEIRFMFVSTMALEGIHQIPFTGYLHTKLRRFFTALYCLAASQNESLSNREAEYSMNAARLEAEFKQVLGLPHIRVVTEMHCRMQALEAPKEADGEDSDFEPFVQLFKDAFFSTSSEIPRNLVSALRKFFTEDASASCEFVSLTKALRIEQQARGKDCELQIVVSLYPYTPRPRHLTEQHSVELRVENVGSTHRLLLVLYGESNMTYNPKSTESGFLKQLRALA